jgi:choline dehydrogenase-like flavoprotein
MLQIDAEHSGVFSSSCDALGRYFHDHVSAATANIVSARPEMLNRLAGHRFVGRTMRSLRFELAPSAQRSDRVGAAFSHITFESRAPTGFDHLRLLLRGIQKRQGFAPRLMASLAGSVPYLARLAFWRYARGQLYWPRPAEYRLHTVVEQLPKRDNRIVLSDARDVFGQRMAAIDWRMDDAVLRTLEACRWRFERYWNSLQLDRVGRLEWSDEIGSLDALASRAGDIFHPGGTTRMGSSRSTALVDGQLRSFALSNLWISSTSTFPAGGGANPTLVLILFTMRLAERLQRELRA